MPFDGGRPVDSLDFFEQLLSNQGLWLLSGLATLALGCFVGEPVMLSLGLAALITAIASVHPALSYSLQIVVWIILSIAFTVLMQGFIPRESDVLRLPVEATVHEEIPIQGYGHVWYNGALWKACCHLDYGAIAPGQIVLVVGRQNNTLIVVPTYVPLPPSRLSSNGAER